MLACQEGQGLVGGAVKRRRSREHDSMLDLGFRQTWGEISYVRLRADGEEGCTSDCSIMDHVWSEVSSMRLSFHRFIVS